MTLVCRPGFDCHWRLLRGEADSEGQTVANLEAGLPTGAGAGGTNVRPHPAQTKSGSRVFGQWAALAEGPLRGLAKGDAACQSAASSGDAERALFGDAVRASCSGACATAARVIAASWAAPARVIAAGDVGAAADIAVGVHHCPALRSIGRATFASGASSAVMVAPPSPPVPMIWTDIDADDGR